MPRERVSDRVVVVAIDDQALFDFGQWPWPRAVVADLVGRIADARPAALGLDILFPEPDRFSPAGIARALTPTPELEAALAKLESGDLLLGRALKRAPSVLGVAALDRDEKIFRGAPGSPPVTVLGGADEGLHAWKGHLRNVPEVDFGASSHGLVSADLEDGIARRMQLVARVGEHLVAGLGVEMVRQALDARLELRPGPWGVKELRFGDYAVPVQADGRAYVRYGRTDPSRFVAVSDVLAGKVDPARFEGNLVLIGWVGLGLLDLSVTPLGETVPGVENHAQLAEAILEERFLVRPAWAGILEAALLLLLAVALTAHARRSGAGASMAVLAASLTGLVAAGYLLFRQAGLLFDPVGPSLGAVLVFATLQAGSLAEAQRHRRQLREQAARMAGELDAAKRIQMGLLPDPREVFGQDARVDVAALLEPARTVGGDFYDCFMLDADRLFFVVADVSGKGLPASLFMASVKSVLKGAALTVEGTLGGVLARAQDEIQRENPESLFVTALAGVLDLRTGELELANAGHEPVWIRARGAKPERFEAAGGPPLCVMDLFSYPTTRRQLQPGEWILAISDGATEAMNPAREFYGSERLATSLGWLGEDSGAEAIVARVRDDVRRFSGPAEQADDLTLFAIRWRGPSGEARRPGASGR